MKCYNCVRHGYKCRSQHGNADCERCDRLGVRCSLRKHRKNRMVGYTTQTTPVANGSDSREEQSFDATMSDRVEDSATDLSLPSQQRLSRVEAPSDSGQDYGSSLKVGGQIGEMREYLKAHSRLLADGIAEAEQQQSTIVQMTESLRRVQELLQKYQNSVSLQRDQLKSLEAECSEFGAYLSKVSE